MNINTSLNKNISVIASGQSLETNAGVP